MKNGLIKTYDEDLLENLRHVYYGGLPASILLLCKKLCDGYCYDRGLLITFAFDNDDFQLVDADIDSITLNPEYIDINDEHYGNHCLCQYTSVFLN